MTALPGIFDNNQLQQRNSPDGRTNQIGEAINVQGFSNQKANGNLPFSRSEALQVLQEKQASLRREAVREAISMFNELVSSSRTSPIANDRDKSQMQEEYLRSISKNMAMTPVVNLTLSPRQPENSSLQTLPTKIPAARKHSLVTATASTPQYDTDLHKLISSVSPNSDRRCSQQTPILVSNAAHSASRQQVQNVISKKSRNILDAIGQQAATPTEPLFSTGASNENWKKAK